MSDPPDHGESKNSMIALSFHIPPERAAYGQKKSGGAASALRNTGYDVP